MSAQTLDGILERVGSLPPLPDTLYRLVGLVSDPSSSLEQIVAAVRYDQAFTAEVLRLCNSAYFGLSRSVDSLDDAIKLLGNTKVLQLVIATQSRSMLSHPQTGYGLPAGALFAHSVGVAIAAQALGRRLKISEGGALFTAGLLHDVGKVVLNEFVANEYIEIAARVSREKLSFAEAEEQVLGFSHPEVGARLGETWNLPPAIVRAIRYHHAPLTCAVPDALVDAIHVADAVCILLGIGGGDDGLNYRACPDVMARHGLTESDVEMIGSEVISETKSVRAVLSSMQGN